MVLKVWWCKRYNGSVEKKKKRQSRHLQARVVLGINRVQGISVPVLASSIPIRITKRRLILRFKKLDGETISNMPSYVTMHLYSLAPLIEYLKRKREYSPTRLRDYQ
jgi:hypothetical protein